MTIGIFIPAFSFTIIGHPVFERLVDNKFIQPFLDGIGAAVIGLLLFTAFQFLKKTVDTGLEAAMFLLAFASIFHFTDKFTQPLTLVIAALAGQAVF